MCSLGVLLLPFRLFPLILGFNQRGFRGDFRTSFGKMAIFVTNLALERQLFIVYFLQIGPIIQFKLDGLWEAFFQINLHTDPSAGLKTLLWLALSIYFPREFPMARRVSSFQQ
jgi:hypothetical protein